MGKLESQFQAELIKELKAEYPGCVILKNDSGYQGGIPDLSVFLTDGRWFVLECKKDADAPARPNQPYFVEKMNSMSFAAFIYPENKEEILNAIRQTFRTSG